MPQLLDLEDIGLGKHELPDDATPDEIKKITDDLVSRNRKSRMAALPATAAEEEGLDKGRVRSGGSSFMQSGVTGVAKPVSFFARMSDMLSAGQLLEASGRTVNPETSKALLQAGTEQANRTPEQRESQLAQDPVYKFGQDLEAGGKEAFPTNPKFKGEFIADVLPNAAGGMVPTIAAGAVNPVAAITQYGATSGQQGAEESIAAGDVKDANKVALAYFGLGALTEGMLGVPAYVMRYVRGAKAAGLDKKVVRETIAKMMAKSGAKEAGQESLEQVGQNVVAQQTFDPNRKLSEGVAENAAAGFILGAGVSGGAHGVGTAAANLEKRDRLEVLNELRNSPAWKQHIGNIGDNLQMRELASAASDRVANAIADRQPIKGADARMAGARNRMAGFSYAYDPDSDVYSPVRLESQNFNASINEVLKGGENNNGQEEKGRQTLLKPEPPPSTTVIDPEKAPAVSDPVVPVKPLSMRAQSQEFDRLIVEHGPEFGWDGDWDTLGAGIAEGGSTMAIEGKKRYSRALQALRRRVSGELGVNPDEVDTLAGRANLLIRLKNHIAAGGESDNLEVPNDANTDFLPPEEKPTPKLAPGVNQGDLIASTQKEDLSLTGERATDSERVAKEKASKAAAEQAAKDFAAKNQLELGGAKPVVPQAPPQKPVALPKLVEAAKVSDVDLARQTLEKEGKLSASLIQRRHKISYARAQAALDVLASSGEITQPDKLSGWVRSEKKSPTETTPREPTQLERFQGIVKLAADSPNKLRASDVDRVMSEANKRPEELEAFRTWVLSKGIPDDTIQEVANWKPEEAPKVEAQKPVIPKYTTQDTSTKFSDDKFEITTRSGASVTGYVRNQDFPNEGFVKDRGEVFLTSVPESARRKGIGYSLTLDAIRLIKENGAKTVNLSPTSEGGRAIVSKLIREGVISDPIKTAPSGKSEHRILFSDAKVEAPKPAETPAEQNDAPSKLIEEKIKWGRENLPFGETATVEEGDGSYRAMVALDAAGIGVKDRLNMVTGKLPFPTREAFDKGVDNKYGFDALELMQKVKREFGTLGLDVRNAKLPKLSDFSTTREFYDAAFNLESRLRREGVSVAAALVENKQMEKPFSKKDFPKPAVPEPIFKEGDKVLVGEYPMTREGTIAASGPYKGGEHWYFVNTNLGREQPYREADIKLAEQPKKPVDYETKPKVGDLVKHPDFGDVRVIGVSDSNVAFTILSGKKAGKPGSMKLSTWQEDMSLVEAKPATPIALTPDEMVNQRQRYWNGIKRGLLEMDGDGGTLKVLASEHTKGKFDVWHTSNSGERTRINDFNSPFSMQDAQNFAVNYAIKKAGAVPKVATPEPSKITVTRDKDFQTNGTYTVTDGTHTDKIFRDPENKWWYSKKDFDDNYAAKKGTPALPLSTENRAEAIQKLQERWAKEDEAAKVKETSAVPTKPLDPYSPGAKVQVRAVTPGKYEVGLYTIVRETTDNKFPDDPRTFDLRNDRTGEIQKNIDTGGFRVVKERADGEKAAAKPKQTDDDKLRELGYTNISTLTTAEKKALIKRGPKGRNLAAPKDEGPAPSLFSEQEQVDFQMSAALRASELRAQANENERLANLRYEAHANGSQRAKGEYVAYKAEANRLRKQAMEFDRMAGNYVRTEPSKVSELKPAKPRQVDLFDRDLSNPKRASSLLFSNSANGLRVMFGQNEFNQNYRELRADSPADLMRVLNAPGLNISDDLRNVLRGMISSGTLKNFPGLSFAITEFIQGTIPGELTFTAEHLPDARLIRLLNLADGKDAAHELMHHLQYYLSAADRDYIRAERYRQIQVELSQPRSYKELATLERVLNKQMSTDEFLNNPDNARSMYHLASEYEYFAWMMQDRAADYFKGTFTLGFIARIKKAIKQFMFALKRVSGLTERHEEIWNEVIRGKYEFTPDVRKAFNERIGRNNTKPTDAPFNSGDRLDPDTAWAQIDSASRLTIPKLVADKIADYRAAEAALEAKEYDTAQYKAAKDKISELLIAARRAAAQTGNDYWTSDEGMERLTASSEYLPDAIRELGIQFDPEALRELQKEIRFEGQSRNLASLRRRLRETEATLRMFQDLGFAPDDYAEFSKTAERLAKRIRRLESNNEVDNARGLTLEQRANEIQEINEQEIEFRAKRDALEIPLVNQVFVAPAENGIVPEARLSRTLKGFIAAMNDSSLSRHYKDAIAKLTWDHIRTFENVRAAYIRWMEARTKEVSNAIRDANQKIATAKIDVGMLEILRDEIGRVGEGERGLTGTLDGREAVQFLNDSFGTMISFARNLRSAYPNGGAQAILTRMLSSFDGRTDSIAQLEAEIRASTNEDLLSIRDKAGVADYALARIIYVLSRSGKMEDAVGALIRYGTRKMGEIPANNLDQIGTLLDSGDAIQIAEATDRLNAMARQAEARQTFAAAELRSAQRELKQATIALKAAERGKELFDSVIGQDGRPSAEYAEIRSKVIEWLRLSEGMILANGGSDSRAGQTATVFKPFSVSAGDVAINQPQVTVDASTEAATKAEDFGRIQHWYDEAEKYVAAYEQADAAFESDPENNPHPEQLGFKGDVYNGLTEALKKKDSYLDPNVLFLEGRVENSPLQQFVMMKGYLGAYFRQMLAAGKNLVGMAGRDVMSKMIDYGNTLAISKKVYGDHRIAIIKARKAALDSHKKYAGNNLELYRTGIFNEMASEGRQFGVNVTEGMKLPVSGEVVTAEDLKLLRAIQEFYDDLRLNVTEKGGRGIIEKSGTEALGTMKVHIRKAASVGEQGLPMQVSREGDGYIKQIQLAYAKDKEAKVVPAAGDDFTEASKSNIVQFWNKNPRSLIRHILDAGRQFRTMSQDPMMLEAEKRAAQELRSENNPLAINTLDDAIALIAKNLPIDRGINVRRFAETNLLSELEQYHAEAKRQYGESTMLPMAEGIGGLSLRSEFTVPASQFHFPSNWYDYGGLTNHQLTMTTARAMHQRYLDLAMSLERAVAAIEGEIISAEKGGKPVNYKSLKEAVRVKQLTESVIGDLKSSWDVNNPSAIHSNINTVFDVFKSSLLGNITVNIRNVVQGSQLYYNIAQSMERYSRGLALLKALNHIGNTASRVPLDILFSQNSRLGRFNKRMLSGPLNKTLHALKLDFAERIVQNHIDRMTAVQQLGFSQRDPWWDSLKAMWGDTNVQQSVRGEMLNKGALSKVSKVAGNVGRSAVLSYRMIGSEFTDKQINPTAISMALGIEKGLADIARFYGESRKSLGNYNPSDKRWMMQPDEFSNRMSKSGKADNLAQLKAFLSGADITLEPLLWNYYQQYEAYQKGLRGEPTLFNDEQRSALRVAALRALNAGDALNRPSTAAHNAFAKLLLTFQGYSSNYWVNFMSTLKNARSTSKWESVALAFPTLAMTAISMAILGLLSDAITSWYAQWAQGAVQRNVTVFDKEFWTDANKASGATAAATTAMNPLAGDAALFAQSLVVNNRGYEPTGRVLAFSLLNSAFQTMRGMFTLASSGDYANMWNPLRDFFIKHAGLGKEAAYNLSPHMGAVKDYSSGIGAYSFVAQQTGQKEDKAPGQVSSGKSYGPTTGIKEDISADFMRRDPSALMADFQKLVKYYASKGMDDPEAIAKRDFQAMNPIVKAMSGKKPTEEQDAKIMASMSDSQRNSVNKAVAGWNWGANVLGVDYSPVSEPRGSSGGAAAAFRPARRISFGGRSTGMRKISTGSRRIRIGKIGGGKARALRSRKIRLSSSGSRRMRSTRPRMRRIRLV